MAKKSITAYSTSGQHLRAMLSKHSSQVRGKKQEQKIAEETGARRVPNSGAIDGLKGDLVHGDFLIESKATDKNSLTVSAATLRKIREEAAGRAKIPAMRIRIQDEEWYIVPKQIWEAIR